MRDKKLGVRSSELGASGAIPSSRLLAPSSQLPTPTLLFFIFIFAGMFFVSTNSFAEDSDTAEEQARQVHQMATSDVIYTQEETKALYYQNLQIIGLLKEIRDLLDTRLEKK